MGRRNRFIPFPRALAQGEMWWASYWIWTQVVDSISYNNSLYTKHASPWIYIYTIYIIYILPHGYIYTIYYNIILLISCLNFWDEAWWFLSLRVFGLLSSSLLLFPKFDKHLKKAGGHIGQNFVEITIKMKTIVWKPLMIKILLVWTRAYDFLLYLSSNLIKWIFESMIIFS